MNEVKRSAAWDKKEEPRTGLQGWQVRLREERYLELSFEKTSSQNCLITIDSITGQVIAKQDLGRNRNGFIISVKTTCDNRAMRELLDRLEYINRQHEKPPIFQNDPEP